jgi:hypothetical protein
MAETQPTESLRDALESTNRTLRRLAKAVEGAKDGGKEGEEALSLWLRRSRRRLRENRALLGEDVPPAVADGEKPRAADAKSGGDAEAPAGADEAPRRRGGRARAGRRSRDAAE